MNIDDSFRRFLFSIFITVNDNLKPSFTVDSQKRLDVIYVLDLGDDLLNNEVDKPLISFNKQVSVLNVYALEDATDGLNVRFSTESTDEVVAEFFELENNKTHILFKKRMNMSSIFDDEKFLRAHFKDMNRAFFKFGIEIFNT